MTEPWDRVQTPAEAERLLADYRRTAKDHWGTALFCRHGLHAKAPCEDCHNELEGGEMTPEDPPVPEPEPEEPTIG